MTVIRASQPFGSRTRTRALLALQLLEEVHVRELSRVLGTGLRSAQVALQSLERDGLVVGRSVGRARVFRLAPGYFARRELRAFLARLVESDPELREATATLRRRPRRTGKPV